MVAQFVLAGQCCVAHTLAINFLLPSVFDEIDLPSDELPDNTLHQSSCNPHPLTRQVLLPELCEIHLPNGTMVEAFSYTTALCPNCLCKATSGACLAGRCCCVPKDSVRLAIQCPTYFNRERVVISGIPTQCVCQSCSRLDVSVVVRVLDGDERAVVLANVMVDGIGSYRTDDQGYVGFRVSADRTKINVTVRAVLFNEYQRHYFIIPGRVNSLNIRLNAVRYLTTTPPQTPFIISFTTLKMAAVYHPINFADITIDQLIDVMMVLDTFDPNYGEVFAYFPEKVFPINDEFTFVSSLPRTVHDHMTQDSLNASFLIQQMSRLDGLPKVNPFFAIGWGKLEIYDEDGRPFDPSSLSQSKRYSILVCFAPSLMPTLDHLQLVTYSDNSFKVVDRSSYIYKDDLHNMQWAVLPTYANLINFSLPLAIAYEEDGLCHIAVRANDPLGLLRSVSDQATTVVKATARLTTNIRSNDKRNDIIFLNSGPINSCVAIPCRGYLLLEVLDNPDVQASVGLSIDVNLKHYESEGRAGPIYRSKGACEAIGLNSEIESTDHVVFDVLPDYCPVPDSQDEPAQYASALSSKLSQAVGVSGGEAETDSREYCSVKVSVRMCTQTVTTVTCITDGDMSVRSASSDDIIDDYIREKREEEDGTEYESGDIDVQYSDCNRVYRACFTFMCESRVNLTVVNSVTGDQSDSDEVLDVYGNRHIPASPNNNSDVMHYSSIPCLPHSNLNSPVSGLESSLLLNIASRESAEFVFESSDGGERGVFRSPSTREVAWQKCSHAEPSEVGVYFDCVAAD